MSNFMNCLSQTFLNTIYHVNSVETSVNVKFKFDEVFVLFGISADCSATTDISSILFGMDVSMRNR